MFQSKSEFERGAVKIVGAGPGAIDLITLRGRDALAAAQVVIHDALANTDLLHFCPSDVEVLDVGKRCNSHRATQLQIQELMIDRARAGLRVVRLKGGDPSVFARLSEETAALTEAGIPFEIVPGVTAACATAATLGTSLTSRDFAPGTVFVTGHECARRAAKAPVDWPALAKLNMTLCVYMGVRELPSIAAVLMASGMSPETPLTIVGNASRAQEHTSIGTLAGADSLAREFVGEPAMILIGTPIAPRMIVDTAAFNAGSAAI